MASKTKNIQKLPVGNGFPAIRSFPWIDKEGVC